MSLVQTWNVGQHGVVDRVRDSVVIVKMSLIEAKRKVNHILSIEGEDTLGLIYFQLSAGDETQVCNPTQGYATNEEVKMSDITYCTFSEGRGNLNFSTDISGSECDRVGPGVDTK